MQRIKCMIGDNCDATYKKEVDVEIDDVDYLVIKYGLDEDVSGAVYDNSYENLCSVIGHEFRLPDDWYIDKIIY